MPNDSPPDSPRRLEGRGGVLRALYRARRILAVLLTLGLAGYASEAAGEVLELSEQVEVSATSELPDAPSSPGPECPPGCVCPCTCACWSSVAIIPTVGSMKAQVASAPTIDSRHERRPVSLDPEPRLRPPLV